MFPVFWYLCKDIPMTDNKVNNTIDMKDLKVLLLLMASVLVFAACSDDNEDFGSLKFSTPAVYFSQTMTEATVRYEAVGLSQFYFSQKPEGWGNNIILDEKTNTVKITLPSELRTRTEEDPEQPEVVVPSGEIVLAGVGSSGEIKSATLFVGLLPTKDLSSEPANCYIITEPLTHYQFRATKPDGTPIDVDHVDVVWQDRSEFLSHLGLLDGKVSFFMEADYTDKDKIREGNAVIGAYDKEDNLLWSWHIWSSKTNPYEQTLHLANGYEMLDRNLGALANANSTAAERIGSYGVYYQWGRRSPFIGPLDYIFSNGVYNFMYNILGHRVYMTTTAVSAEVGTVEYATVKPLDFIMGDASTAYDWMWTADNTLWSKEKGINDPCPYGWKVAPADAFTGLKPEGTPEANAYELYGVKIGDGQASSLWMGAGRMVYNSGRFQNIYNPLPSRNVATEAQPWEGLYWTADADNNRTAQAFHFWYNKAENAYGVKTADEYQRANGMPVRCVRDVK